MNLLDGEDPKPDERDDLIAKWKDKSAEELLKAKVDSDLYIKTLEKQKDELRDDYLKQREELLAKAKFEELIDRYEKAPKADFQAAPEAKEESQKYDPKELETLVKKEIQETRIRERQEANYNTVLDKLKEHYGDKYRAILKDTGLSANRITEIAMESPEALYKLVGLTGTPPRDDFQTPPRSNQRNDTFSPKGPIKRTYAYYQEMKKANPKLYLDKQIAVQMHNDVIEMGEAAFYGTS